VGGLRFGCSGWDYEEWVGPVYARSGTGKLRAYSSLFDTVEINSTFYRNPSPGMVKGWIKNSPEGFRFAAKIPQAITHDSRLDLAAGTRELLEEYLDLMRPLLDAGKLGPLLFQLPPSSVYDERTTRALFEILPPDFEYSIEFRHQSWLRTEPLDLLREFQVSYAIVDEPLLPPELHVSAPTAYIRWHGQGTRPWYNYHYSKEELESWVPRVRTVVGQAKTTYGFFNNHYHGYAPENCLQILEMLGVALPPQTRGLERLLRFQERRSGTSPRRKQTLDDF